jgi:gliding motility-associated-like protein
MKEILSILLFTSLVYMAHAQNLSNKGKDFWVGYGHHQFMEPGNSNSQEMVIYLSAEQPATVTVTIEGSGTTAGQLPWTRTYNIPANTVISTEPIPKGGWYDARLYTCPPGFMLPQCTGGEGVFKYKGIHIVSNVPIVSYAHIYGSASSGATMLMPVETWGYSYMSINSRQEYQPDCYSWMYVIAEKDNTVIEITPSVPTRNGRPAGVPFIVTLQRGEIYQVVGANPTGGFAALELSGTTVRSIANAAGVCYPVAVFAGSSRTGNPASCGVGGGDNDNQQMFPTQAWGKRYLTAPTSGSATPNSTMTNSFKIAVKDPATKVYRSGTLLTGAVNNIYRFESNVPEYIESDKPIMVAQFMTGGGCLNGSLGDPEMMYISPIEQAIKHIGFFRNNQESIQVNNLTMIVPNGGTGLSSLRIDGQPLSAIPAALLHTYTHPKNSNYTVVVKKWNTALPPSPPPGQALVDGDSAFTAITYGLGNVESYGYNAGTLINNLNVIGAIHNTLDTGSVTNEFTCVNTPVDLSMLIAYKPTQLVWKLSTLGSAITPNTDVTMTNPVPVDSVLVKGVPYYKYTLTDTYYFSVMDTFEIPVLATHPLIENCNHTEEVKFMVIVKGKPRAGFTFTHTGCTLDTVYFKGPDSTAESYAIDRWKWTFPGPALDSGQQVKRILPVGTHTISLTTISTEGCVSDSISAITIYAPPVAGITASAAAVCEGGSITFEDNSSYGGSAPINSWYWSWGNGVTVTVAADTPHTVKYANYGSYTVKHVVKVSDLCISDTASTTVTVYAKPNLSFTYPAGCLPTDGIVQFTSTTTTPDGQAINSYNWNFGDPNATPANPNTSTLANPVHTYSFGNYNIYYSVTTANGCTRDTTVAASFNIRPSLTYGPLAAVCASLTTPVSVATAAVTNGVTGTGVYSGPGTTANGRFNPSVAGAGTHTITYTFTSTGGCVETITTTITVYPKPTTAFTASSNICLGQMATFTDQSTISSGAITAWKWNFGDGTQVTNTNNNPFTRSYTTHGNYSVKLVAVSDMGCTSDTVTHLVAVHPLPVTDFSLPAAVCMPGGTAEFTNQTTVADNSGLTYKWDFGDGSAISNAQHGSHVYASKGSYNVRLEVTSGHGCTSAITKTLRAFFDKPIAQFAVAPDTLCQGADNVFTDQSTSANSAITKWEYNFGDGTTSNKQNPVKQYASPGYYNVTLLVTNSAGCTSNAFSKRVTVYLQPVIDAGPSFVVPQGTEVKFNPKANDSTVLTFHWSPGSSLSNANALRPTLLAMSNGTYTLTAIGQGSCTASDFLTVKILKPVNIPNAFSPNGDGIHDKWEITNLSDYPGATVEVFNRYGQRVYYSGGYGTPWDGKVNGTVLPVATYYYVIHLKNGFAPRTGSVTILK